MKQRGYIILLVVSLLITIAGILTLIPREAATKECMLGYKALCTFSPASSIACFILVGINCSIRKKKFKF